MSTDKRPYIQPVITEEALANPKKVTDIHLEMSVLYDAEKVNPDDLAQRLSEAAAGMVSGPLALVQVPNADPLSYHVNVIANPKAQRKAIESHWEAVLDNRPHENKEIAQLITTAGLSSVPDFINQTQADMKKIDPHSE